ncbi:histidine--tRNA ligase [Nitrososphaera viennensis]|uniref:Histidine--tRNA ligase n=1 Tax=Nitrososphaera viennensis TaxID=1034015 RepID=A0A977IET4_9ARCH|nr:histidine--tRNA ligase [Nitrososphaera viennensis]UVS69447.1 histidine--tRNA ligase [Nitrososphaera viennensis]
MKLELPRGMRDIESDDLAGINFVREKFFETARLFNFRMMEPSPLEMLSTLEAKSGASISNEIYAFKDKGDRDVALRFDLTIGLTRHVAARRDLKMPAKIAAFAGVWRYDEPQAGRYRYFHQWDIEVYGPFSLESDAEVIEFVSAFFKKLGLAVSIQVNDRQLVEEYIRKVLGISEEEKVLEMFRAVDKVPKKGAQGVLAEYKDAIEPAKLQSLIDFSKVTGTAGEVASKAGDVKGLQAWQKLSGLMDSLASRGVANATINLGIVRGLDYYSGIVFEVFDASGEGGALVGGGRYDRLTDAFGRKDIGATGAAGGIERIVLALQKHKAQEVAAKPLAYVAYATGDAKARALEIASMLRNAGIATDYDMLGRALRKQLDDASTKGAAVAIIVAPAELAENKVTVKSMKDGSETKQDISRLAEAVSKML